MIKRATIALVLRSGGDFDFQDVELIARHICGKWKSPIKPRIICFWDGANTSYSIGNLELVPLKNTYPGTWARMILYSPEIEKYRPFLYVDLDTAIIASLENILDSIKDPSQFITLEDFWQKRKLATGLVWIPSKSVKVRIIWEKWMSNRPKIGFRMDNFLREVVTPDAYWQHLTDGVVDFKSSNDERALLRELPNRAQIVCFHGKPRIRSAAETIDWVKNYVEYKFEKRKVVDKKVTVIIPYNKDRGWLGAAVASVPEGVQLIMSQGNGNWPSNFNKGFEKATGDYIKYLHEDDTLTENCIEDSVRTIDEQNVDFIHGNAYEISQSTGNVLRWRSLVACPTAQQLAKHNTIHSATLMYRRSLFEKVGLFSESEFIRSFEEFEFNLRCLKAGMKIGYCPSFLAFYRRHNSQLIRVTSRNVRENNRRKIVREYI